MYDKTNPNLANIQRQNYVVSTSMRRNDVASTLIRRSFNVLYLLERHWSYDDSGQSGHPPILIRVLAGNTKKLASITNHWAHIKGSYQPGSMPRLI